MTGLAFLGANLGALEIMGMGAGAAQYGIMQSHYYWIGAIPAMVFVALFMIPFYYASRVHSVPAHSGTSHSLAIGFYIAALVLIFGVTLVLDGLLAPAQQAEGHIGFNVNLWWGLVMVVSGCVILGMTLASPRRRARRGS